MAAFAESQGFYGQSILGKIVIMQPSSSQPRWMDAVSNQCCIQGSYCYEASWSWHLATNGIIYRTIDAQMPSFWWQVSCDVKGLLEDTWWLSIRRCFGPLWRGYCEHGPHPTSCLTTWLLTSNRGLCCFGNARDIFCFWLSAPRDM